MQSHPSSYLTPGTTGARVLAVVDWTLDPSAVVDDLLRYDEHRHVALGLLVPAWLHGLDWAGDPTASVPCAQRQVDAVDRICGAAGISLGVASVGDPDPVAAITDLLYEWPAGQLLLYTPQRGVIAPPPFDLAHRVERATGLPVRRIVVRPSSSSSDRRRWLRRSRHCTVAQASRRATPRGAEV